MAHDKRLNSAYGSFDRGKAYTLDEAVKLVRANAKAKFDETVEFSMNLGVDPRHADQMVRGVVNLPKGTGKTVRVGVFARGPKGLMPNPKLGTVTMNVAQAVKDAKSGQVEYRVEKAGIIHSGIGKASFPAEDLRANFDALVDAVVRAKPSGAKGKYVKKVAVSSSMGPGIKVDTTEIAAA